MTGKHRGYGHLRSIPTSIELGSETGVVAPEPRNERSAMQSLTGFRPVEPPARARLGLYAVPDLEPGSEKDFTAGATQGSLAGLMEAATAGEHLTQENFQGSDFMAARRARAAQMAGHTLGAEYAPRELGNQPTEQFASVPPRPDDAS